MPKMENRNNPLVSEIKKDISGVWTHALCYDLIVGQLVAVV